MIDGGDIYGDGVNITARIEDVADPGDIWVDANVHDPIENKGDEPEL